jgi:hypothetical protein
VIVVVLNATFRSLGVLFGPVIGSALLLGPGPTAGIFATVGAAIAVGLFGAVVGVHWSLGSSAAALCAGTALTALVIRRPARAPARPPG